LRRFKFSKENDDKIKEIDIKNCIVRILSVVSRRSSAW